MEHMSGQVSQLLGYRADDILCNALISYVGLTHEEDKERVFGEVDAAIELAQPWDVAYRINHQKGHSVWVRERGNAVYERGELVYLQGLVVNATAEFDLHAKLERGRGEATRATRDIVHLTEQITTSVRELSMLSINARIEAARSGEAGKGFAVVANEIKTLADRNAGWADKITSRINELNQT
jgi:hypothetical protein